MAAIVHLVMAVCLCVCPFQLLTFASLDLETSFSVHMYVFGICRLCSYIKVIGTRSRSQEQKTGYMCVTKYAHVCFSYCLWKYS